MTTKHEHVHIYCDVLYVTKNALQKYWSPSVTPAVDGKFNWLPIHFMIDSIDYDSIDSK